MSGFLRMTLAMDFIMTGSGVMEADLEADIIQELREEKSERSVTHIDYIRDDEGQVDRPRFILKLQKTIEVCIKYHAFENLDMN